MDYLEGKSESEIRRAATFWFMAAECYQRGEPVPPGVFLLSTSDLTDDDVEWAQRIARQYGWEINADD